jgi:amidohydrolase
MDPKAFVEDRIRRHEDRLIQLSHRIHSTPELAFEEERASSWVADALADAGFSTRRGVFDLPTAVDGLAGRGRLHVGICAEYDALPALGHACGHNVIAAAAVGAGIGLADLADELEITIHVIGTPGEEAGDAGGKVLLAERGAFADLHAAMMVHPAPYDVATPLLSALGTFQVNYVGKASHAAAYPELGINAADALTVAQTAIGLLRQHILPTDRIHGVTTKGGDAPNIVPANTSAKYMVRSQRLEDLETLRDRVFRCFEAGAVATGATLDITGGTRPYAQVQHDLPMAGLYQKNAETLGRSFPDLGERGARSGGSTDMGNVSLIVPSIHPFIGLHSWPVVNHQPEFAAYAGTAAAHRAVIDGAIGLAWTAIDIATDPRHRSRLIRE